MNQHIIPLPSSIDFQQALRFSLDLDQAPSADEYVFDLNSIQKVRPFGMLYTGAVIRSFVEKQRKTKNPPRFRVSNFCESKSAHSYAAHVGFFRSWGAPYGYAPGEASGSSSYKPIKSISMDNVRNKASELSVHHGVILEEASCEYATFLSLGKDKDVVETLTYSLREIMRNVYEHSTADKLWLAGQYWESYDRVELAILDQGVGLMSALRGNPKVNVLDHKNAVFLALQPGVSGKLIGTKRRKGLRDDEWANSGYGLFVTSNICKKGGSFSIASGDSALYMDEKNVNFSKCKFHGTAIRLSLNVSEIENLKETTSKIVAIGRKEAMKDSKIGNLTASLITSRLSNWDNK